MGRFGDEDRGERTSGDGMLKMADLLQSPNDEIEVILCGIEEKRGKGENAKAYNVFYLFTEQRGEIVVNSFSSNLDATIKKAVAEKRFNPRQFPMLIIGCETITGPTFHPQTGAEQFWHNVYVEAVKEPCKKQADQAFIDNLRRRAKEETKCIVEGRPFAPAVATAKSSRGFDIEMNEAMNESDIPF